MIQKITIDGGKKAVVKKVRVEMDVYAEDGETLISQGQFVDIDEEQIDTLGAENIQPLADIYFGTTTQQQES